jgi:hypothetical protein
MQSMTYSRFDDVCSTDGRPWDTSRVPLTEDGDGATIDDEFTVFFFDSSFEPAVDRVILEHIDLEGTIIR